jgi:hypothetical protein
VARLARHLLFASELLILSALILTTRCANYQEVFVGEHIYFTDPDCYARMTRVRLCAQRPGLVLRHHAFENYPEGTTPHTTAPFDYAILGLRLLMRPFTSRSIDLAGAFISPVLALLTGGFLCWWARYLKMRFRWAMLTIFAVSPILTHATALGRPDHQSLALMLVIIAICAEWSLHESSSTSWNVVRGLAWSSAIWVSAYEPLILFIAVRLTPLISNIVQTSVGSKPRTRRLGEWLACSWKAPQIRSGVIAFIAVMVCAILIERRFPVISVFVNDPFFRNWSNTIGELAPIPLRNWIWIRWVGWLVVMLPFVVVIRRQSNDHRNSNLPVFIRLLLLVTFGLTMWQARWGYFFAAAFSMSIPALLGFARWPALAWLTFGLSLWPVAQDWDERLWPNDVVAAHQLEQRYDAAELRELSVSMIGAERRPFLAPWWLSPAISYWSGQPGVAGSSHESLSGIVDSARFYLSEDPSRAAQILQHRGVSLVISYDAQRLVENSASILGKASSTRSLAWVLDQRPTSAPSFLTLSSQNGTVKSFEVTDKW